LRYRWQPTRQGKTGVKNKNLRSSLKQIYYASLCLTSEKGTGEKYFMGHPLFPFILMLIVFFVYFPTKFIIEIVHKKLDVKIHTFTVPLVSSILITGITYSWWYSETSAQRWAKSQCEHSKLHVYNTVSADGFFHRTYSAGGDLLAVLLDGSFEYVETRNNANALRYSKYYISNHSDVNCQHEKAQKKQRSGSKKRKSFVLKNSPELESDQCIAINYSDTMESRYEYYSNTRNARGKGNRRQSIKEVRDLETESI